MGAYGHFQKAWLTKLCRLLLLWVMLIPIFVYAESSLNEELFQAIERKDVALARQLVEKGGDINQHGDGGTVLIRAAGQCDLEMVRFLIDHGADIHILNPKNNRSALMEAADCDNTEVARVLIQNGADVNAKDSVYGDTALILAARKNRSEVAYLLVENHAQVNVANDGGYAALMYAVLGNNLDLIEFLLKHKADVNNASSERGETALMRASYLGNEKAVRLLIEHGADVNMKGKDGGTALFEAILKEYLGGVKMLVEHGADVNLSGKENHTALTYAISRNYSSCEGDVVAYLLENHADVNVRVAGGQTPLMIAASSSCCDDVVRQLVAKGAEINAQDNEGQTALMKAFLENPFRDKNASIAQLLVEKGGDLDLKNKAGLSARMIDEQVKQAQLAEQEREQRAWEEVQENRKRNERLQYLGMLALIIFPPIGLLIVWRTSNVGLVVALCVPGIFLSIKFIYAFLFALAFVVGSSPSAVFFILLIFIVAGIVWFRHASKRARGVMVYVLTWATPFLFALMISRMMD